MEELVTAAGAIRTGPKDLQSLFAAYLVFIDRSERTTGTYAKNLRQFCAWMSYSGITAPTREDIIAYRNYLITEHEAILYDPITGWRYKTDAACNPQRTSCRPNTAAQYLRTVCAFFTWAAQAGLYPNIAAGVHAPKIRNDTHRKEALSPADVLRIERSIEATAAAHAAAAAQADKDRAGRIKRATAQGKRLRAIYLLAVNCGLRTVEISRANVKDIETRGGQAYLYIWGKGHAEPDTRKPLAPEVKAAIDEYLQTRTDNPSGSSPLFVSTGNRSGGQRIAPTTISTMLKQALQTAGYDSERITAHSLRHTAGTSVMSLTEDLFITQQYMRHSNPATTEIYLHNQTESREARIAQQLYNLYHQEPEQAEPETLEAVISSLDPAQLARLRAAIR